MTKINGELFYKYKGKTRRTITSFPMYQHFVDQLLICSERYYNESLGRIDTDGTNPPLVSDYMWDSLDKTIKEYEAKNPDKILPWSRSLNGVGWNKTLQERFDYLKGKSDD